MTNFEKVGVFMKTFGQEVKQKASFSSEKINKLRYDLIKEELGELKDALEKKDIISLSKLAKSLGMEVLIEIHNVSELEKSCIDSVDLIGVNNRNLKTFDVNIQTSIDLINKIPSNYTKISESGISKPVDIITLKNNGFDGFLIGETFMKTKDPGKNLSNFINEIENEN